MVNSNDFSLFALFTAGLATVASAYTTADTSKQPSGNPTSEPAVGVSVPCGKPYAVTWKPTTPGTVTIYVCEGPSTNCQNQPVPIAVSVANSGTFSWTPSCSLKGQTTSGLGLQIVSDADRSYQYTPQFGISGNTGYATSSGYASSSASATATSKAGYSSAASNSTSSAMPTYTAPANTTVISIYPSSSMPAMTSGYGSPSTTAAASSTPTGNAGVIVRGSAGLAMGLAAAFFAL